MCAFVIFNVTLSLRYYYNGIMTREAIHLKFDLSMVQKPVASRIPMSFKFKNSWNSLTEWETKRKKIICNINLPFYATQINRRHFLGLFVLFHQMRTGVSLFIFRYRTWDSWRFFHLLCIYLLIWYVLWDSQIKWPQILD